MSRVLFIEARSGGGCDGDGGMRKVVVIMKRSKQLVKMTHLWGALDGTKGSQRIKILYFRKIIIANVLYDENK